MEKKVLQEFTPKYLNSYPGSKAKWRNNASECDVRMDLNKNSDTCVHSLINPKGPIFVSFFRAIKMMDHLAYFSEFS